MKMQLTRTFETRLGRTKAVPGKECTIVSASTAKSGGSQYIYIYIILENTDDSNFKAVGGIN